MKKRKPFKCIFWCISGVLITTFYFHYRQDVFLQTTSSTTTTTTTTSKTFFSTTLNLSTKVIEYNTFKINPPNFVNQRDKDIFFKLINLNEFVPSKEQLLGVIDVKHNAVYDTKDDCGYRANYDLHKIFPHRDGVHVEIYDSLLPLLVPDGWSFQHFTDGVLPKIAQAYDVIQKDKSVKLLLYMRDRSFPVVRWLLNEMGIGNERIVEYQSGKKYVSKRLFLTCKTPPLHPLLWNRGRDLVTQNQKGQSKFVILVTRNGKNSFNGGRLITNQQEVRSFLKSKYSDKFIEYDSSKYSFEESRQLFLNAHTIIGVHGGGMFNQLFSQKNTNVVEIMPTNLQTGAIPLRHKGVMVWIFSELLQQNFWRIPLERVGGSNVRIPQSVLEVIQTDIIGTI